MHCEATVVVSDGCRLRAVPYCLPEKVELLDGERWLRASLVLLDSMGSKARWPRREVLLEALLLRGRRGLHGGAETGAGACAAAGSLGSAGLGAGAASSKKVDPS